MKTTATWMMVLTLAACAVLVGCDTKPEPLRGPDGRVIAFITVDPESPEELDLTTALLLAEENYRYRLEVLEAYYEHIGVIDKDDYAEQELANLNDARWFEFSGVPEIVSPEGESVEDADERLLVEYTARARNDYKEALATLRDYYYSTGQTTRARAIERIDERLDFVRTYAYYAEAEVPGPDLRPVDVIPEADEMFAEAMRLYHEGQILPAITDYRKERQALSLLLELVRRYPTSTKISLAAFYIGEIYKEYFDDNLRAVAWYERSWQWDSSIPKPARFQAAVVYDLRMREYEKALQLYQAVLRDETFSRSNVDFARDRIPALQRRIARMGQQ